jgi:hypothetical protein
MKRPYEQAICSLGHVAAVAMAASMRNAMPEQTMTLPRNANTPWSDHYAILPMSTPPMSA